ncbi:MAG: hypothetical protein R3327_03685 [Nitrosopumilaceae archaeon]|nr:hypothetical protein [Nitrosopumilaceae archaeon]
MVTYDEYLKNVLDNILDSYNNLNELSDKSGDLEIIKKELLTINGYFQVLIKKLGTVNYRSDDLLELKSKISHYLESYYFEREIEIMSPLYSEDPNRIRNIRFKILEALNDKKLTEKIRDILGELND